MRLLPRSLRGRLLVTAGMAILVALIVAAFAIGQVLERFVTGELDARLDAQIAIVARAVRPDGLLDRSKALDLPPYDRPGSGWVWQVRAPGGVARSASLAASSASAIDLPNEPAGRVRGPLFGPHGGAPRPLEWRTRDGHRLHGRVLEMQTSAGPAIVLAMGPRSVIERTLREAVLPLAASIGVLAVALGLAILVQLRLGLRPLARLGAMLGEVRAGRREHVSIEEPTELLPLVDALNALIDSNAAALARARGHVANLAHGLKTPLATLRLDLAEPGRDPGGRLGEQVGRIDAQVRHHLGRARAGTKAETRVATALGDHIGDLVATLARIHADRAIVARVTVPGDLLVRCDPQDLDEMLGNLLDNAWRWARGNVSIDGARDGRVVRLTIEDDGPGVAEADLARLCEPGERLDEREDGHGFGIPIARELAELHGGGITLGNAGPAGGLRVTVELPAAG